MTQTRFASNAATGRITTRLVLAAVAVLIYGFVWEIE